MKPHDHFIKIIQLVLLIALVETISLVCLKKGNRDSLPFLTFCGSGGYLLVVYILYKALSFEGIGKINLMWNCVTIITAFICGHLLFDEKINKYTLYSIVFALVAIYFLHLSDEENEA
jgi:multidrug transporter EmrE-like cation transporter